MAVKQLQVVETGSPASTARNQVIHFPHLSFTKPSPRLEA